MTGGDLAALILDNGGDACKVGFAGDYEPAAVVRGATYQERSTRVLGAPHEKRRSLLVGGQAEAAAERDNEFNRLSYALDHGVSTNWDCVEQVWTHAFREAGALGDRPAQAEQGSRAALPKRLSETDADGPLQRSVLATEVPFNPLTHREKMVEVLFETFGAPALQIAIPGALALHAAGARTGVVVDAGHGVSYTVPVFEFYVVQHAVHRLDVGGRDLTEYLALQLAERQRRPSGASGGMPWNRGVGDCNQAIPHLAAARRVKEQLCYVAQNFNEELTAAQEQVHSVEQSLTLPDGSTVVVGPERVRCPEALFQPKMLNPSLESPGLQDMAHQSIINSDMDTHQELSKNVVLVGGSVQFRGMQSRMQKELSKLLRCAMPLKVTVADDPVNSAFVGGSIMASMNSPVGWCSMAEYEELGACQVVRTKCPSLLQACEQIRHVNKQ